MAKKIKSIKAPRRIVFVELKSLRFFLADFTKRKKTFILYLTSYTARIRYQNIEYVFCKTKTGTKHFYLNKIFEKKIKDSTIEIDSVDKKNVKYFNFANVKDIGLKKVYNIDIVNCYPTQFKNFGFITNEELDSINKKYKKFDKLRALGMLATKTQVINYERGIQGKVESKQKKDANVFFAICDAVGDIMEACMKVCKSFVFFWFDGIYFTNKSDCKRVERILKDASFTYVTLELSDFFSRRDEKFIYISYLKGEEKKTFLMPSSLTG